MERAVILCRSGIVTAKELPLWKKEPEQPEVRQSPLVSLESVERDHIARTLAETGYHKSKSAAILGISRRTLDRKIAEYSISIPE